MNPQHLKSVTNCIFCLKDLKECKCADNQNKSLPQEHKINCATNSEEYSHMGCTCIPQEEKWIKEFEEKFVIHLEGIEDRYFSDLKSFIHKTREEAREEGRKEGYKLAIKDTII